MKQALIPFDKERAAEIVLKIATCGPDGRTPEETSLFVLFLKARVNLPKADVDLIKSQPRTIASEEEIRTGLTMNL